LTPPVIGRADYGLISVRLRTRETLAGRAREKVSREFGEGPGETRPAATSVLRTGVGTVTAVQNLSVSRVRFWLGAARC